MNNELNFLKRCDGQIHGLQVNNPDSQRLAYLKGVVRPDILTRITLKELTEYETEKSRQEEESRKISPDDLARMNANKDSESI